MRACVFLPVFVGSFFFLCIFPHAGYLPLKAFRFFPVCVSGFVPCPLQVSAASSLLWSLWTFFLSSLSGCFFPSCSLFWCLPVPTCLQAHIGLPVCPLPVPATCCCEVSIGCVASVQGSVCSPCPSLHLLAQASAATLRLAAGGCLAKCVCEGVSILSMPQAWHRARPWRGMLLSGQLSRGQQAGVGPGMLIPGADSHRAEAALSLFTAFFSEGQGHYLTAVSFSPALSPTCLISPGTALGFPDPGFRACPCGQNIF